MSISITLIHRAALSIAMAFIIVQSAQASPPDCTCKNLKSLQQDYQNAVYLAEFFAQLQAHMEIYEEEFLERKKTDPYFDKEFFSTTGAEKAQYIENKMHIPNAVEGYTGPDDVGMEHGTCEQNPIDLDRMEAGSPCKAIADAALNHEAMHRRICNEMTKTNQDYWGRRQSEYAAEEVKAYKQQAGELKDELRRVLDEATITYEADWTFDLNIGGVAQYAYTYSGESEDIGNATAGDTWTMSGKGTSTVAWIKAVFMGKKCTPSGAVDSTYDLKMTTDGLTFGLELTGQSSSGGLSVKCPGPGGGGGQVADGGGEGVLAENLPLNQGINSLPGDMGETMRAMLAGMGTVGGGGKRILSVTCDAP